MTDGMNSEHYGSLPQGQANIADHVRTETLAVSGGMTGRQRALSWATRLARWVIAAVFLYAGLRKIGDPALLAGQIRNYHLAPWWLVHPMAIVLPWLEICAAGLAATGIWIVESIGILTALSLVFLGAIGWALYWELEIQCGCFGKDGAVSWGHLGGNASMVVLGATIVVLNRKRRKRGRHAG